MDKQMGLEVSQHEGLRVGDEIIIRPTSGAKRRIPLTRTYYAIKPKSTSEIKVREREICLPGPFKERFHCELCFVRDRRTRTSDETRGRFLLRSLTSLPFKVNGTETFEAYVDRGDRILFGYNLAECQRERNSVRSEKSQLSIPESIVKSELNIMLTGETGVGKTSLAKEIHQKSGRTGNFVHLNLSSFSPQLIESELFGHVKGAFTGAVAEKMGAIHEACHGTLFLDEVDSLPLDLQTKLLLLLDSFEYRPVGGTGTRRAKVRFIFASCSSLEKLVQEKKLRRDLYFRLTSGATQNILPLRERKRRIREIVEGYTFKHGLNFSGELLTFYEKQLWPGNIRQLVSHLEKKRLTTKSKKLVLDERDWDLEVGPKNMGIMGVESDAIFDDVVPLDEMRRRYARKVYKQYAEKVEVTSKALQVSPTTLRRMLRSPRKSA